MSEEILEALKKIPFLREMQPTQLKKLNEFAHEIKQKAGTFVTREGTPANALYLIQTGRVALEAYLPGKGATQIEELLPGDLLGLSWFFSAATWQFDARAIESVTAIAFDGVGLRAAMDADPIFGYAFARPMLKELYERLQRSRMQRLDIYKADPRRLK